MDKNIKILLVLVITVLSLFGGFILQWEFSKDWTTLSKDNVIIVKEKWVVEAERSYFNLYKCFTENGTRICVKNYYAANVKCPKIIADGGYETAKRCYYPDDTYEALSRSLINTEINIEETNASFNVEKITPYFKYGTRGSYGGLTYETLKFLYFNDDEKEFPYVHTLLWVPKDTRNYKVTWRVENLKQVNLSDGIYSQCFYDFGNILIDLKNECSKLDYAEIKDGNKIYFHFLKSRGEQFFDVKLVDPISAPIVVIDYPVNNEQYNYNVSNLNYTVSGDFLDSCGYLNSTKIGSYEQYTAIGGSENTVDFAYSQTFTVGKTGDNETFTVNQIRLYGTSIGSTPMNISIQNVDNDGQPNGDFISLLETNVNAFNGSFVYDWTTFNLSEGVLEKGKTYAFVYNIANPDITFRIAKLRFNTSNPYGAISYRYPLWTPYSSNATASFELLGNSDSYIYSPAGINFTNVPSVHGINTWKVQCNNTENNFGSDSISFFKDDIGPNMSVIYPLNSTYNQNAMYYKLIANDVYNNITYEERVYEQYE